MNKTRKNKLETRQRPALNIQRQFHVKMVNIFINFNVCIKKWQNPRVLLNFRIYRKREHFLSREEIKTCLILTFLLLNRTNLEVNRKCKSLCD